MTHSNSLAAYHELRATLSGRRLEVLDCIEQLGRPATDRQIKDRMGFYDMNQARPRITELVQLGLLQEVGSIRCKLTGKSVRLVKPTAPTQHTTLQQLELL